MSKPGKEVSFIQSVNIMLPIQVQALYWALGTQSSCDILESKRDYRPTCKPMGILGPFRYGNE